MDWIRGERLGHGSFAAVSLAAPKSGDSLPPLMAVKTCSAVLCSSLVNEKLILEELKGCPVIIRCLGDAFSREDGEELYNVLLEYAPGGDLAERVRNCGGGGGLPEGEVRRHTRDLLRGLRYIHEFGYVHCDIKLQNILLDSSGGAKIADFGLTRRFCGGGGEVRGTPMYMSPEMVAGGKQGAAADIWALGCVVSEMSAGRPALNSSGGVAALLMRIGAGEASPEVPGNLSDEGKDFLRRCFVKDPRERWTAEMLLRHPFVNGQDIDDEETCAGEASSVSPRCPFDFSGWASPVTCSITSFPSPMGCQNSGAAERLCRLVGEEAPDWSVTKDWVTVRRRELSVSQYTGYSK